jgi:hypothetical protein
MRAKRYAWIITLLLICCIITIVGCSSSSSSSSGDSDPVPEQDISGIWWGYIGPNFTVGIIDADDSTHYSARFVCSDRQFMSPSGMYLVQGQGSYIFTGYLDEIISGTDYATDSSERAYVQASAYEKSIFGLPFGRYSYVDDPASGGTLVLYYNTTYDLTPNLSNLNGDWVMTIATDDTLGFTINSGNITGGDSSGNEFEGTIIIRVSDPQKNVYGINLELNNHINTISLDGLAAYIAETDSEQIQVDEDTILAISATNSDRTYSVHGLATKK